MSINVMTKDQLVPLLQTARTQGKRIVFTNGCFDLMHVGHTRYLQAAKNLGDLLVVAEAPDRPIVPEAQRAEVVSALSSVDYVVLFKEPDPQSLIAALQPDVLVKGGDKPASFVPCLRRSASRRQVGSSKSSTYPHGYASGFDSPAALLPNGLSILLRCSPLYDSMPSRLSKCCHKILAGS
ncbi:MAG: hypothetical protein E8D51_03970 [Nitrospira sp.]|nr:MAG: hypothetical protein E8D51_03970 [Nitrospira sp.]